MHRPLVDRTAMLWVALTASCLLSTGAGCSSDASPPESRPEAPPQLDAAGWQRRYTIPISATGADGKVHQVASLAPFPAFPGKVDRKGTGQRTLSGATSGPTCEIDRRGATRWSHSFEKSVVLPLCGESLTDDDKTTLLEGPGGEESPPWSDGRHYVWEPTDVCDVELARMEFLLCAADHLLAWSQSSEQYGDIVQASPSGPDTHFALPVLPTDYKFVPRDLATYYLSQIPRMDAIRMGEETCSEVLRANELDTGTAFGASPLSEALTFAFSREESLDILEANEDETAQIQAFRRSRVAGRFHILRAGARLLEKAGRLTLEADRGIAEQSNSKAADPQSGAERFWGVAVGGGSLPAGDAVDPYNSMAHAMSYFYGRWERRGEEPCPLGSPTGAVHYSRMLEARLPGVADRIMSFPPTTRGGRKAAMLLQEAEVFDLEAGSGTKREVLASLLAAKRPAGLPTTARDIASITDADLEQGLQASRGHAAIAGMFDEAENGQTTVSVDAGLGVAHGAPVGNLNGDAANAPLGEVGSLQLASVRPDANTGRPVDEIFNFAAQNYGAMAIAFARRTNEAGIFQHADLARTATTAAHEIMAWAGPGWIDVEKSSGTGEGIVPTVTLTLYGMEGEVGGTVASGGTPLVLVHGTAREAECVAGARSVCPAEGILEVLPLSETTTFDSVGQSSGLAGLARKLVFSDAQFGLSALEDYGSQWDADRHPYLVQKPKDGKKGKVLTAIGWHDGGGALRRTTSVVSGALEQMASATLGLPDFFNCSSSGVCSIQRSDGYCLADRNGNPYPRDLFIPLENELTSDGDQFESSWKHYISRAKDSAGRTDELGRLSYAAGVEVEKRREAAQERLAQLCGGYGIMKGVTFVGGVLNTDAADATLRTCLGTASFERAYLGECPKVEFSGECACAAGIGKGCFTGLELAGTSNNKEPGDPDRCLVEAHAVGSLYTSPGNPKSMALRDIATQPQQTDRVKLLSKLRGVTFEDRPQGPPGGPATLEWSLRYNGSTLMDSFDSTMWPACRRTSPDTCADPSVSVFDEIFNVTPATTPPANIRWRVLGALSQMARIAGVAPPRLFSIFVPQVINTGVEASALNIYAYSPSYPQPDISAMAPRVAPFIGIPDGYLPSTAEPLPGWLERIRGAEGSYRLVKALSTERKVDDASFAPFNATEWLNGCASSDPLTNAEYQKLHGWESGARSHVLTPACGDHLYVRVGSPLHPDMHLRFLDYFSHSFGGVAPGPGDGEVLLGTENVPGTANIPREGDFADEGNKGMRGRYSAADNPHSRDPAPGCMSFIGYNDVVGKLSCLATDEGDGSAYPSPLDLVMSRRLLRSATCSPDDRAMAFANSTPVLDHCEAAQRIGMALGLGCRISPNNAIPNTPTVPPPIQSASEIPVLEAWLLNEAEKISVSVGSLYIEDLPGSVRDLVTAGGIVATKSGLGEVGLHSAEVAKSLYAVSKAWAEVASQLRVAAHIISKSYVDIRKLEENEQQALAQVLIGKWALAGRVAEAASKLLSANEKEFAAAGANALSQAWVASEQYDQYDVVEEAIKAGKKADELGVLLVLTAEVDSAMKIVDQSIKEIQIQGLSANAGISAVRQAQRNARHEVAIASGEPFYKDENGHRVYVPVNLVLDREYDTARLRYEESLHQSKYLAYLARRAIEQRLLVKLEDMKGAVGPLPPPVSWMDDICTTQGIRYEDYNGANDPKPPAGPVRGPKNDPADYGSEAFDQSAAADRARGYIGDYVAKLETLVDYYNVSFPSHEGEDQTVVSFRDDVGQLPQPCMEQSRNLLLRSGHLERVDANGGWSLGACHVDSCLRPRPTLGMADTTVPNAAESDTTWLRAETIAEPVGPQAAPPGVAAAWQEVGVDAGDHVLSFWAHSRDADGAPGATVLPSTVRVAAYDSQWNTIASRSFAVGAGYAGGHAVWDARKSLSFAVPVGGPLRIAVSVDGVEGAASVLVGNMQLERVLSAGAEPSEYQGNGSSRSRFTEACSSRSAAAMRDSFRRECEADRCWYEAIVPFTVNTSQLGRSAGVERRLAAGNFNYRHMSASINVVGTGVLDCSREGPSCYGGSVVEFDLEHTAFAVPLVNYEENIFEYNFGRARINHGKALAAERFITVPVAASDQSLLSQLGVEKREFMGRPLDGSYRLRIWDRPALDWSRVEDIQLVLQYRYWSKIDVAPQSP